MKKRLMLILAVLMTMSFAAVVSAEDIKNEGTITSIDTIANTFVLRNKSGDVLLYVRPMSHMRINGENKPLSGIPSGSEAKCTLFMKDGRLTVRECIVAPKK